MRLYLKHNIRFPLFKALWLGSVLLFSLLSVNAWAYAQQTPPDMPVYVVQFGDTAWSIAQRFGISVDDLVAANALEDASRLDVGQELVIPGLSGVQGYLQTIEMPWGETMRSLSRKYALPLETFIRLNRLTSPAELYAGANVILPVREQHPLTGRRVTLGAGVPPLEVAGTLGISPWELAFRGGAASPTLLLPQDVLLVPGKSDGPGALPPFVTALDGDASVVQGKTLRLHIQTNERIQASGILLGFPLTFFADTSTSGLVALQGIPALQTPGLYPVRLEIKAPDGTTYRFEQSIAVLDGEYAYDPPITVDPKLMDPTITAPEDQQLHDATAPVTPRRYWQGQFVPPVDAAYVDCWPSLYGNRRSYNNSGYIYFHTGLDFCGQVGHPIYAVADGVVVFTGETVVHGNMTIIDHGWGVYSVYAHQSEIDVREGDVVTAGQLIGKVGATGRVTGPHLHLEVWVNGVQVDPWQWLTNTYP